MLKGLIEVAVKAVNAGKAKGDLDAVGKSAHNVGQAHNAANKAAGGFYATQAKGVIGTSNSTKSFSKMASTMNGGGGLVGAYATLAANVFAVTAAFNALRGAAQVEQITRGLEILGNRSGQTLGIVAKDLRDITNGAISTEQALRSTAQITSAGFKSDKVLAIGKLATDVSLALGRDMTDSMDRLTRGIIKLEPELLDELGLMTRLGEASAAYALQLGKPVSALTTLEKRQGFMNAIMAEGELKFGGVSDAAGNLKNYDKLAATFADLTKNIFKTVNALGGLNIAGFLADNMMVLAGAAVLFLSTLKNQLLPGILSITATAKKAADEAREAAVAEQKDILGAHKKLGSNPAFLNEIIKVGPENASNEVYSRAIAGGQAATAKEQEKLDAATAALDKHTASKKASAEQTEKLTNKVNKITESLQNHKDAIVEVRESQIASLAATKAAAAQDAVTAASNLSIMGTIRGVSASMAAYRAELQLTHIAAGGLGKANTFLAVSLHGVKLAAQAAGAALLSIMSWVGIAFAAIGALVAVIKALETEEQKLENKKAKELTEIYGQLGDKLKELNKINNSNVAAHLARQAAITLEANAIKELADKYDELQAARAANGGQSARTESGNRANQTASWWKVGLDATIASGLSSIPGVGGIFGRGARERTRESFTSARLGVAQGSEAMSLGLNAQDSQSFEAIKSLSPERANALRESFAGLSEELKSAKIAEAYAAMRTESLRLADATTGFTAANNAAAASVSKLATDVLPKTDYDSAVNDLSALGTAMESLFKVGSDSDIQTFLGTLNASIVSLLDLKSQQYVADSALVANLEQQKKANVILNETQIAALAAAKERLSVSSVGAEQIREEVEALETRLRIAQEEVIVAKSRSMLLSARIDEEKTANSFTLVGLQKEMNMQNEIVASEVRALQIKKDMLEAQYATQQNNIAIARTDLELYRVATERLKVARLETEENAAQEIIDLRRLALRRKEIAAQTGTPGDQLWASNLEELITARVADQERLLGTSRDIFDKMIEDRRAFMEASSANIDRQVEDNRRLLLSVNAVSSEISAASLKGLSAIEQANKLARLASVINRRREDQENAIATSYRTQLELRRKNIALITRQSNAERDFAEIQFTAAERLRETTAAFAREREDNTLARREGASTTDAAVRAANEAHWNIEDDMLDRRERAALALIDYQTFSNQLQAVYFDSQVKGVEIQQNVLSMLEKQAAVRAEMNASARTLAQAEENLSRRRSGYAAETREGARASEIEAAFESLKIADREYNLKLLQIDMEYDLLDARTKLLREETRVHLTNARATNRDGVLDTQIAQLEAVDRGLGSVLDNSALTRASAKATAENIRETARVNLEASRIPEGSRNATGYDRNRLRSIDAEAQQYLTNRIESQTTAYIEGTTATRELTQAITDYSRTPVLASVENSQQPTTTTVRRSASQEALALGREINSRRGFRADEHSQLGGVTPVHTRGSLHDSDRALDINYSGSDERAKLDALATELRRRYGESVRILWRTTGHMGHLHIEFLRETYEGMVSSFSNVVSSANTRVEAATAAIEAAAPVETPTGLVQTLTNPGNAYGRDLTTRVESAVPAVTAAPLGIAEALQDLPGHLNPLIAMFGELGPEGQAVTNAIAGIGLVGDKLAEVTRLLEEDPQNKTAVFSAMADTAVAGLGVLRSALEATSQAKIASIDREIAAEQKRDGKSADSVAKIAALEKKKEASAKKAFEINKKIMMAQAAISVAAAVVGALAAPPLPGSPFNIAMATAIGAMGAIQLAMIASTSYSGGGAASTAVATPSTLSIGKRGDSVDLAKNNANAGGEVGYLRGAQGRGSNASNYSVIGSAVGGSLPRGYGNTAFVVGEHGPETITPETPITVRPVNDNADSQRAMPPVNINIQALDAKGVEEILYGQRGNIIGMLREAANNSGQTFLESVNTAIYNKPNVGRL